jgi:alpha-tubulin suppressor-like RCC1 family protein
MCFGFDNAYGQLGTGGLPASTTPAPVSGSQTFASLSTSWMHTLALTADGTVYCWGANLLGSCGTGLTVDRLLVPTPITGAPPFVAVSAGDYHSCALTAAGTAYCWGDNEDGQVGDGTKANRNTPTRVMLF